MTRLFTASRGLAWLVALGSAVQAVAACADALRLEPPDGGVPVGVGSGGGAVACLTNFQCAFPTPVCDELRQLCVECLTITDCAHKPGTVCSMETCVCPDAMQTFCELGDPGIGVCTDLQTSPEHCGQCKHTCFGTCAAGVCADPWEPVSTEDAPSGRGLHVAVWVPTADMMSGSMIVWGGYNGAALGDGAKYDLATFEWTPISPVGAPSPRYDATVVWTGTQMIVWGGNGGGTFLNSGGRYDPATNKWDVTSLSGAPSPRAQHTAVWTGMEMIVFGGQDSMNNLATGAKYNPTTDTWTPISAAPTTRREHVAVYTGTNMWVHGGIGDVTSNNIYLPGQGEPGGRAYAVSGDSWTGLDTVGEPSARAFHTAVWDGNRMLVFGGFEGMNHLGNGFALGSSGMWMAFGGSGPVGRRDHSAVWLVDAAVMVVYGGRGDMLPALGDGGVYDPATNTWTGPVPTAIEARYAHTAVSTGTKMIVWGGLNGAGTPLRTGGVFTP